MPPTSQPGGTCPYLLMREMSPAKLRASVFFTPIVFLRQLIVIDKDKDKDKHRQILSAELLASVLFAPIVFFCQRIIISFKLILHFCMHSNQLGKHSPQLMHSGKVGDLYFTHTFHLIPTFTFTCLYILRFLLLSFCRELSLWAVYWLGALRGPRDFVFPRLCITQGSNWVGLWRWW